jgi:hypothetical protein
MRYVARISWVEVPDSKKKIVILDDHEGGSRTSVEMPEYVQVCTQCFPVRTSHNLNPNEKK